MDKYVELANTRPIWLEMWVFASSGLLNPESMAQLKNTMGYRKASGFGLAGMGAQAAATLFMANMKTIFRIEEAMSRAQ